MFHILQEVCVERTNKSLVHVLVEEHELDDVSPYVLGRAYEGLSHDLQGLNC